MSRESHSKNESMEVHYPSGAAYIGQWNLEGDKYGFGTLTFQDGARYTGQFALGLSSGYGVMVFSDGSRYAGEFLKGKFNGYGVFTRHDKMLFHGQFHDGKPEGYGLITFPDGSHGIPHNEGYFENFKLKKFDKSRIHIQKATQAAEKAELACSS